MPPPVVGFVNPPASPTASVRAAKDLPIALRGSSRRTAGPGSASNRLPEFRSPHQPVEVDPRVTGGHHADFQPVPATPDDRHYPREAVSRHVSAEVQFDAVGRFRIELELRSMDHLTGEPSLSWRWKRYDTPQARTQALARTA